MDRNQYNLYINNISARTDEDVLKSYFSQYGQIESFTFLTKTSQRHSAAALITYGLSVDIDYIIQHNHRINFDGNTLLLRRTLPKCPNEYPTIFSPIDSNIFVPGVDKHAFELLEQLLRMDPSERITADDGLHSCLFDNYRKEASGEPSSEEAFQLDLSPYNLQEIRSMLFQKVRLIHQQMQDKALFLNEKKMAMEEMDCC